LAFLRASLQRGYGKKNFVGVKSETGGKRPGGPQERRASKMGGKKGGENCREGSQRVDKTGGMGSKSWNVALPAEPWGKHERPV